MSLHFLLQRIKRQRIIINLLADALIENRFLVFCILYINFDDIIIANYKLKSLIRKLTGMAARKDIPFLIEGQHEYGFGWHKVSSYNKIYKALRPANNGVLVFRDSNGNQALDAADLLKGLDPNPNTTINIHWSGIGTTNFSAGCQVIAGASYLNHLGNLVNCRDFAAKSYAGLGKKTRGAYNVFADLILSYAPLGVRTLAYTLTRDDTAFLSDELTVEVIEEVVGRLQGR